MSTTVLCLFLVLFSITLANSIVMLSFIKRTSEKITLLSHIALQYINEQDAQTAKNKIEEKSIVARVNSNKDFITRGRR